MKDRQEKEQAESPELTALRKQKFNRFLLFWLGSIIAAIGSGMTSYAIGVYVFENTDSTALKSIVSLLGFLPTVLLAPFFGSLADRYDRRKIMIMGDGLSLIGVALILFGIINNFHTYEMILVGVTISAIFSAAIEPASMATISDLVDEKDYTKASGLIGLASASRFLIAPVVASFMMTRIGLQSVLIFDILTIFTTIFVTLYVRRQLGQKESKDKEDFKDTLIGGIASLKENRGILHLVLFASLLTLMVGILQELSVPMLLSFTDKETTSLLFSCCAIGMLISSIALGSKELKEGKLKIFTAAIVTAGLAMIGFGSKESLIWIGVSGFIFFMTLPIMNTIMDYYVRTNIPNERQGRVFGLISTISQIGYIIAYASAGFLADYIFRPLLVEGGALAGSLGKLIGIGSGRGIGLMIMVAGLLLAIVGLLLYRDKEIRKLRG